ncbi:hypothetical protein E2C01_067940 [Portunus trituberculatus]|uniref:Uncharacterized protein n=1 Tax=Portunus trituberculatus TaxID=210409 RepID=A0A5B7HUZ8_PORTR|nr:hypothetical protein [Portunus trituberculatus]
MDEEWKLETRDGMDLMGAAR